MAWTKCTMLFSLTTKAGTANTSKHRIGGWSESWYDESSMPSLRTHFLNLCRKRANCLPAGAAIIGQRYQQVDPVGPSQTDGVFFPGKTLWPSDAPQMSLQCKCTATGGRNIRTFDLRGIPDQFIVEGEYEPDDKFDYAIKQYGKELIDRDWNYRGRDLSQPTKEILSITDLGVVQFAEAHGFVQGNWLRILRTENASERQVGGRFNVATVSGTNSLTITGWPYGLCGGGKARLDGVVYPRVATFTVVQSSIHKVGRNFKQYRGRRSKSR